VDKSTVITESVAPTGSDVLQRCAALIVLIAGLVAGVMSFDASTVGAAESSGGLPPTDAAYRGLYAVTETVLAATPAPGRDAGRNTGVASATASMSCDDAMRARVNQLLEPYGVPVPVLTRVAVTRTGAAADYFVGEIQFRRCLHDTELAHEVAHHVVDWTAGSWAGVVATARGFCPGLDDRGRVRTAGCRHAWSSSKRRLVRQVSNTSRTVSGGGAPRRLGSGVHGGAVERRAGHRLAGPVRLVVRLQFHAVDCRKSDRDVVGRLV